MTVISLVSEGGKLFIEPTIQHVGVHYDGCRCLDGAAGDR